VDAAARWRLCAPTSIVAMSTPRQRPKGSQTMTGTVRTLRTEKGFGFIKDEAGQEYFFHQSAIYGEGIADLREGDGVTFDLGDAGPKGPRAENVRRTST
jgi:cold shock protein